MISIEDMMRIFWQKSVIGSIWSDLLAFIDSASVLMLAATLDNELP